MGVGVTSMLTELLGWLLGCSQRETFSTTVLFNSSGGALLPLLLVENSGKSSDFEGPVASQL